MELIPDTLKGTDLTKPITRAEFAAVSVKAYESLSGKKAAPASRNPFTDTKDAEVLKAYNVGITAGVSAAKFDPAALLNREQAATMLTRVFKKYDITGWTLATDAQYTLQYAKPAKFADDAQISAWAKDSVYFMAANGIIAGVGNNNFAPKNTTSAQEAAGYADATREQAIVIAARMVENLSGKTVPTTQATPEPQPTPQPGQSTPAGLIDASLIGTWAAANAYYQFRSDGTYSLNTYAGAYINPTHILIRGKWQLSGGTLSMTQRTQTSWTGSNMPPEGKELSWENLDNNSITIEFGVNPYTGKPSFKDVAQPDVLYTAEEAPDWMFF